MYLKEKQLEGLGNFFLDVAKGMLLASYGSTIFTPIKFFIATTGSVFAIGCVFAGLYFLGRIK